MLQYSNITWFWSLWPFEYLKWFRFHFFPVQNSNLFNQSSVKSLFFRYCKFSIHFFQADTFLRRFFFFNGNLLRTLYIMVDNSKFDLEKITHRNQKITSHIQMWKWIQWSRKEQVIAILVRLTATTCTCLVRYCLVTNNTLQNDSACKIIPSNWYVRWCYRNPRLWINVKSW